MIENSKDCPNCGNVHKQIPGYLGYFTTDNGTVTSYRRRSPVQLAKRLDKDGYELVNLYAKGKRKTLKVHRVVMMTYSNDWDPQLTVNHRDGNKLNNHISNLEMCTAKENLQHAHGAGMYPKLLGEDTANSKLTEEKVLKIRELHAAGVNAHNIAYDFNVHVQSVYRLSRKSSWGWL